MDYSKYHFNYFDVIKRHERIINRPKDWEIKLLAFIMLFVTFCYVFTSGVFASETEDVSLSAVTNIAINPNGNYFISSDTYNVYYFNVEKGYKYSIKNNKTTAPVNIAKSNNIPALNGVYDFLIRLEPTQEYSFIGNGETIYLSLQGVNNNSIIVTRTETEGQSSAINNLVDNVGANQIWGVFENGISFVGVVVLVAFGLFLVVLAIKKVSKGKSEF